jgi:fibronectin type 3 domain-containing protein
MFGRTGIIAAVIFVSKFRSVQLALLAAGVTLLSACAGVSASSKASSNPGQPAPSVQANYSVALSWNPSDSSVMGYNLYRSTQSGGPYAKLNSSPMSATSYTDSNIVSGTTYYYVSTAVNSADQESAYSNQASATVP